MTTVAGSSIGSADGTVSVAQFGNPLGVAVNSAGTIYIVDNYYENVRVISSTGVVTTLAGRGTSGMVDGTGTNTAFRDIHYAALDTSNNMYIADRGNSAVRKVTSNGVVSTVYQAALTNFRGLAFSSTGVLYAAESPNYVISVITTSGTASKTIFVGSGSSGYVNGQGTVASFGQMNAIAFNTAGTLFVTDAGCDAIRKVSTSGKYLFFLVMIFASYLLSCVFLKALLLCMRSISATPLDWRSTQTGWSTLRIAHKV
jgi:hypothetical protein